MAEGGYPKDYLLAHSRILRNIPPALAAQVIQDDGRRLLIRAGLEETDAWLALGFEVRRLSAQPMVWVSPALSGRKLASPTLQAAFAYNSMVRDMIQQVQTTNLYNCLKNLVGIDSALVGGSLYEIFTRNTGNQPPTQNATQYCLDYLRSLGYTVSYQNWNIGGYSNRNVIASYPGVSQSNEIIVVIAHLDNIAQGKPIGTRMQGADDNASGSASVLTAASILRKYRFDKTLRFVLVTGEEQGLYGSAAYAGQLAAAGAQVSAVLNMDMIAWDSDSDPTFELHTRTTSSGGYAYDRAIAAVFTNVVRTYGLSASLNPILIADSVEWSDHASFWDVGYPAIVAIEYDSDFTPYYHTTNDTLSTLNLTYLTYSVKAVVGTAAHLAQPADPIRFDSIRIDHGEWTYGGAYGLSSLTLRHETGATETGPDGYDRAWTNTASPTAGTWFKIYTLPYASMLSTDARPTNSETLFHSLLAVVRTNSSTAFGSTNRLRFSFSACAETNRVYSIRLHIDSAYTTNGQPYDVVTNLRQVVARDGFLNLPGLTQLTNGVVYGYCDIGTHSIDPATNKPLGQVSLQGDSLYMSLPVQAGVDMIDRLEGSTNLIGSTWTALGTWTNRIPLSADNFDSGWQDLPVRLTNFSTNADAILYRVQRQWLAPN